MPTVFTFNSLVRQIKIRYAPCLTPCPSVHVQTSSRQPLLLSNSEKRTAIRRCKTDLYKLSSKETKLSLCRSNRPPTGPNFLTHSHPPYQGPIHTKRCTLNNRSFVTYYRRKKECGMNNINIVNFGKTRCISNYAH